MKKIVVYLLAVWSIGLGLRFLHGSLTYDYLTIYPNMFDILFDWCVLIGLGLFVLLEVFYEKFKKKPRTE